jgi:exopolysaccharide biosynthesis polyprenyl glycosylphosphotransferase
LRVQLRTPEAGTRRAAAALVRLPRTRDLGVDAVIQEGSPRDVVARRDRRFRRTLGVADLCSALLALVLCVNVLGDDQLTLGVLAGLPLVLIASKLGGLYDRDELVVHKRTLDEAPALLQLATLYTLTTFMLQDLIIDGPLGRDQAAVLWVSLFVFGIAFRRIARFVASRTVPSERLLLIGDAGTYARLEDKLAASGVDAKIVGRMSLQRISDFTRDERPVDERTLRTLARDLDVHRVLVVPSQTNPQVTLDLVRTVKALGIRVSIVPHVFDVVGHSVVFDDICGMTLLGVREFALPRSSLVLKRTLDLVGGTIALIAAAPVLLVLTALIKLDSRGPVLFRQERIGRDGQRFRICKFRSMVPDAEARKEELNDLNEADGLFKIENDPRVTRIGRILRRTSLDELPQLFNVLRGQMSLVGPRPLIAVEDRDIKGYDRQRLHLTPGMTGHWQIMGSSRVPMHEMVKIDYLYVTTWSLFEDLKILARTVPYMLARRGM